mgnify:CR=1 FL=1|tara:strand:+ start:150 stop:473 length:324 start_codon:yes stop_codon:yes gene_type:complete
MSDNAKTDAEITLPDIPITDGRLDMIGSRIAPSLRDEIYESVGKKELLHMGKEMRECAIIAAMIGVGFKLSLRALELGATCELSRVLGDDNWLLYATQGSEPTESND